MLQLLFKTVEITEYIRVLMMLIQALIERSKVVTNKLPEYDGWQPRTYIHTILHSHRWSKWIKKCVPLEYRYWILYLLYLIIDFFHLNKIWLKSIFLIFRISKIQSIISFCIWMDSIKTLRGTIWSWKMLWLFSEQNTVT